jgi:hypothetical protein
MAAAREYHTATLLGNGKVLVTGGYSGSSYLSSAELYDPVNNSWSSAGNMATVRAYHTAAELGNGKVLVTGGYTSGNSALSSAELFDPIANSWVSAGNMAATRVYHAAAQLGNGEVLVTGGLASDHSSLSSAELFDDTNSAAPTVTTAPISRTIDAGQTTTFTAAASGTPTPTVKWQINTGVGFTDLSNGGFYSGVTTTTLTITSASTLLNGDLFRAVFTNGNAPDATSNAATLTVNPTIRLSPTSLPDGTFGNLYNQTITASNGTGNKTMMVTNYSAGGTGLAAPSPSANTVTFNSTPTVRGTVSFDLTATDTVNGTTMQH